MSIAIGIQMPSGAVQGGTVNEPPSPAVFNTGQVIFGWVRAFKETGTQRYLDRAQDTRVSPYLRTIRADDPLDVKNGTSAVAASCTQTRRPHCLLSDFRRPIVDFDVVFDAAEAL